MPSFFKLITDDFVGQKRKSETLSVNTLFISSGILLLYDLNPDSTCAIGIDSFDAAKAPARVEFVSPKTNTNSGFSETYYSL